MRALVTGAAGFIGSHLCDRLVAEGWEVVGMDDLSGGSLANVAQLEGKRFHFMKGDISEPAACEKAMVGVDVVFHNAARKMVTSIADPRGDALTNAYGALNLLVAAQAAKVKRFVYASTGSVYGEPTVFPYDEEHAKKPRSPYGVSKYAAELYCNLWKELHGLDTVVLRYFNVYGPRQGYNVGVIPIFAKRMLGGERPTIFGDGTQTRSFTYVEDVVAANLLAARTKAVGEAFNVSSGVRVSLNELVEMLNKRLGTRLAPRYEAWRAGDIKQVWPDVRKAERVLGFKAKWSFEKGLAETVEWVRTCA